MLDVGSRTTLRGITYSSGTFPGGQHCRLRFPVRPTSEMDRGRRPLEGSKSDTLRVTMVSSVSSAVAGDHEIGAIIAESGAQGTPTPRSSQVEWHESARCKESRIRSSQSASALGKAWVSCALSRNAALYFTDADDAQEKIGRSLPFEPLCDHRIALPFAQFGKRDGIDKEHQRIEIAHPHIAGAKIRHCPAASRAAHRQRMEPARVRGAASARTPQRPPRLRRACRAW